MERFRQIAGWTLVMVIGLAMLATTFGLQLFHRLDDAQKVLDDFDDVMAAEEVKGLASVVDQIDLIIGGLNSVIAANPSTAPETRQLVSFLSGRLGVPAEEVARLLQQRYPRVASLLALYPLSSDGAREFQQLISDLSRQLGIPEPQLQQALAQNFPNIGRIAQAVPAVARWEAADTSTELGQLHRFDGTPVTTIPEVVRFLKEDVVPRLQRNVTNFEHLDRLPPAVRYFPWFFVGIGSVLILLGASMLALEFPKASPLRAS